MNNIKQYLTPLILLILLFSFVSPAQAAGNATLNFTPETKEVKVGESFNINVVVDLGGESLDTVRAVVSYPADKLRVVYFALNNLYPNVAPGNFIDNNNGLLSQGGAVFGGQVSESGIFGTITFEA